MKQPLNEQQRRAVEAPDGPVIITAGPGTGKTKTLVTRIEYLVRNGMPAERILALTFTNKAAREMQERLAHSRPRPHVTTFHSLAHQLLTEYRGSPPEIIPNTQRQQIIRDLKKSHKLKGLSVRELELALARLKGDAAAEPDSRLPAFLADYRRMLASREVCDFDDLLHDLRDALTRGAIAKRFHAILVDEFQDTNALQYELLTLLNVTDNLFVIGDRLQAIYGFRGGSAEAFERFTHDWPAALQVTLGANYRSAPEIVRLTGRVFPETAPLTAQRRDRGVIGCTQVLNEYGEAGWIINCIEQHIGGSTMLQGSRHQAAEQTGGHFRDFAVLYRTHRTATILRRMLDESGLPYQIAGEGSPYAHPDVIAVADELKKVGTDSGPPSQLIAKKAANLGFDVRSPELRMLVQAAVRFDDKGLQAYLDHLDGMAEQEFYDPVADAITLLTIHAAKGLEFSHVFIIGAEDGLLPLKRPHVEPDLEEERRLFYVAVSRARDRLDILHAKRRGGEPARISEFVTSLPPDILPRQIDPDMALQQERARKRAIKRSQASLF